MVRSFSAFASTKLVDVVIPSGVKTVKSECFYYCRDLRNVIISEGVENIDQRVFAECKGLVDVTLPKSIKDVPNSAFFNCNAFKKLRYGGTVAEWNAFEDSKWFDNVTVFCTDGTIN